MLKPGDKQFLRSLKTKDRKLAERRLSELRAQVGKLKTSGESRLTFAEVAQLWKEANRHTVKPSTVRRWDSCIKNLTPFFAGMPIRNVQSRHCERWLTERASKIAPQSFGNSVTLSLSTLTPGSVFGSRKSVQVATPPVEA